MSSWSHWPNSFSVSSTSATCLSHLSIRFMSRFFFNIHSWMGLIAGLGLLVIGLTGSILVFKGEIDMLLSPESTVIPDRSKERLNHDEIVAAVQKNMPGHLVMGWKPRYTPGGADAMYIVPKGATEGDKYYIDPTTGSSLGSMSSAGSFTDLALKLHYTLLGGHVGEALAGIFAAMLCLLGISGFWLYRSFWRTLFLLRWGRTIRIFCSDFHKMVGISSMIFNLILGFTGAWWNLSHMISHVFEDHEEEHEEQPINGPYYSSGISLEAMIATLSEQYPNFTPGFIGFPYSEGDPVSLSGKFDGQNFLRSDFNTRATFDPQTGTLKKVVPIHEQGAWDQIEASFIPLHFGNFGGLAVKILWCLGGLTPAILSITGFIMWAKRKKLFS